MQTVFKHIACHRIAEAIEEVHANTNQCEVYPWFVAEQVNKRFQTEFLCTNRFQSLLGQQTAYQRANRCQCSEDDADNGILMLHGGWGIVTVRLFLATDEFNDIGEAQQGDEAHCVCTHHTER